MRKKAPATAATPGGDNHRDPSRLRGLPLVLGILLLAANLRPALTGVAPLIGQIRTDTDVSNGVAGLLTTLPLLAFGALSPVAPRLARQFGMERTVLVSLLALAVGIVVRSMGAVWALFLGTAVVGAAIVVGNVLLPGLVKREFPGRVGLMTSIYTTALGISAALAAGVSVPIMDLIGIGWRGSLALWALPPSSCGFLSSAVAIVPRTRPPEVSRYLVHDQATFSVTARCS